MLPFDVLRCGSDAVNKEQATSQTTRSTLVLVAGAPATGKTTLARRIGAELGLPVLHRDLIRDALADVVRERDQSMRQLLVPASFAVFYALMDDRLAMGGLVAETNFQRGTSEASLQPRCASARAVLIRCRTTHELSVARFRARFATGVRHWSSFDAERLAELDEGQTPAAWRDAQPLDLEIPTLVVDTTDDYDPDLDAILAFICSTVND